MHAFRALLILSVVTMSLFATSMAHAGESVACVDSSIAIEMGHADGDGDQVPADGDKGYPHHHAGCHNHQVAAETETATPLAARIVQGLPAPAKTFALPAAPTDPALRPPQA